MVRLRDEVKKAGAMLAASTLYAKLLYYVLTPTPQTTYRHVRKYTGRAVVEVSCLPIAYAALGDN